MKNADAVEKLKSASIAPSAQRLAIYRYLDAHRTHPTAETVWRALLPANPTLSRTTVHNTLRLFARRGVAQELTIEDGELRYDANAAFHAHFKCEACGKVLDLFEIASPVVPDGLAVKVRRIALDCYGLCQDCARNG